MTFSKKFSEDGDERPSKRVKFESDMPPAASTKRKRTADRRPSRKQYKRRRSEPSVRSVVRSLARLNAPVGPFGDPKSANFQRYGPNNEQMMDNPGWYRTGEQNMNRTIDQYTGPGDYKQIGHWASRLGGAAIGAARGFASGGIPGALAGAAPGYEMGAEFSRTMGWGDYKSSRVANQIMDDGVNESSTPVFVNARDDLSGDITLSNREYVCTVTATWENGAQDGSGNGVGAAPFQKLMLNLNPTSRQTINGVEDSPTFPFLSNIAKNFEMYEWEGLVFQYIPTTGEGGTNSMGKIIMATNYDPLVQDTYFGTAAKMQNYDYATSCKPSIGMVHGIETDPDKRAVKQMYVSDTEDIGTVVKRSPEFETLGKFFLAIEGVPPPTSGLTVQVGELWVTYKCKLTRAKVT